MVQAQNLVIKSHASAWMRLARIKILLASEAQVKAYRRQAAAAGQGSKLPASASS